ncbi:MAG: class I SAM-dependent methyltransferase [Candidatus Methylomirabilales bacterium]
MQRFRAQFRRPTGFWGNVAGLIMAYRPSNRERNSWTISLLDIQRTDRVLEIGFGPGVAIQEMSRIALDGLVVGLDHSETMLRHARKRNATAIRKGAVDLILGPVSALPPFNESFDKILTINSFHAWDEPVERLKELRRVLRPGGLIAITEQPRSRGATDETAQEIGKKLVAALNEGGFSEVRLETKKMKPVSAVCALAAN